MRNFFFIFSFCFAALILQTTLFPSMFSFLGGLLHWKLLIHQTLNITLLILMYICFTRDFFSALFWMIAILLMQNTFEIPWKSSLALSYIFLLVIIYILQTTLVVQYSLSSMLVILGLIFLQHIFHLIWGSVSMGFDHPIRGEVIRMIMNSLLMVFAVPVVFSVLYYIDSKTIFHFDKSKSFFGKRVGL